MSISTNKFVTIATLDATQMKREFGKMDGEVAKFGNSFKAVGSQVTMLRNKQLELREAMRMAPNLQEFQKLQKEHIETVKTIHQLIGGEEQLGRALEKTAQLKRRSHMVGMQFNRMLQDSPYFLSSFTSGIRAIGDNIPMFAESLAYAKREGHSFGATMKGMFTGMGGWMLLLNLVVAGVTALGLATRGAGKEAEKTKKAYSELETQLKNTLRASKELQDGITYEYTAESLDKAIKKAETDLRRLREDVVLADVYRQRGAGGLEVEAGILAKKTNDVLKERVSIIENISTEDKNNLTQLLVF